ncbi:CDP-diacylglycerol diphosphatase [Methylocella silvestris]|uniref:CDP-diacylglycerol diphosphatase n=1 Tax=Methylocella silvestris TaxID=199596 RepID=UPI00031B3C0E|nr:CDP-diacylglycerol diphosphatase [Methylocella silvestris]
MLSEPPKAFVAVASKTTRSDALRGRIRLLAFGVCALWVLAVGAVAAVDSNALWTIVHGPCTFNETHFNSPAPCARINLKNGEADGWAVLKDIVGRTQFLLIPTRRLSGMEDPLLGGGELPNYWIPAWATRKLVADNAKKELARDDIAMAINGAGARSQDQLHIHVDCVRSDVRDELRKRAPEIGSDWADFRMFGQNYRARRMKGEEPQPDPFRLLAEDPRSLPLRDNSLAVIGASFADGAPGFIAIAQQAPGGATHLEDLQDHFCKVAAQ